MRPKGFRVFLCVCGKNRPRKAPNRKALLHFGRMPARTLAPLLNAVALCAAILTTLPAAAQVQAPDWAQPGSATHTQVPPPADFHRPTVTIDKPIGIFTGQADIGGPLVPGGAEYDTATHAYTIHSAGYNIWYQRDEFRFLWKKMSGDA